MDQEKLLRYLNIVLGSPCCCRYCDPRISSIKHLGGEYEEYPGVHSFEWRRSDLVILTLDDPGCYANRYIEGFGTIFTCYGIIGSPNEIVVEMYDTLYNILGKDKLLLRRTMSTQYYYTKSKYEELRTIARPYPREVTRLEDITRLFQAQSIASQVLGLILAVEYKLKLLILSNSSLYAIANTLLDIIDEARKIVLILPLDYDQARNVLKEFFKDKRNTVFHYIKCKQDCIEELIKSYKYLVEIIHEK